MPGGHKCGGSIPSAALGVRIRCNSSQRKTSTEQTMAFIAVYSDGYRRTIAGPVNTLKKATKYAKDLEVWFNNGSNPDRKLVSVEPK